MSNYKLIALDLDGTLNNSNKEITLETKKVLIKAQQQGIKLVIATGRPTPGLRREVEILDFNKYDGFLLSYNGAKVDEFKSKKSILNQTLTIEEAKEVLLNYKNYAMSAMTYLDHDLIAEDGYGVRIHSEAALNGMGVKLVDHLYDFITFAPNKILFAAKDDNYMGLIEEEFKKPFEGRLSIYRSAPFYLEVMAKDIDKAKSLDKLVNHLNISRDEVIAFGDGYNDLSMIEYAGMGVAMGNANNGVKEKANLITDDHDHDGIAKALYQLLG